MRRVMINDFRLQHDWIMIIRPIPVTVEYRPELMSIYPSWPNPDKKQFARQKKQSRAERDFVGESHPLESEKYEDVDMFYSPLGGAEANRLKDRKITVNGQTVVVHVNEYSILDADRMAIYVDGSGVEHPSHFLEPFSVEGEHLLKLLTDTDFKNVYESALIEGATTNQAVLLGMGVDIANDPYPAVGWYRLRDEYKEYFGIA